MPNLPNHAPPARTARAGHPAAARRFNGYELARMWTDAGGKKSEALLAAAIALAESGGRSDAVNHNTNGSTDTGLWQINSIHGYNPTSLLDPRTNAQIAVKIRNGSGWKAWTTFTSGAYKSHTKEVANAVIHGPDEHPISAAVDAVGDGASAIAGVVTAPLKWGDELGSFLHTIQDEDFWRRILMFALGIICLGLGAAYLARTYASGQVAGVVNKAIGG